MTFCTEGRGEEKGRSLCDYWGGKLTRIASLVWSTENYGSVGKEKKKGG